MSKKHASGVYGMRRQNDVVDANIRDPICRFQCGSTVRVLMDVEDLFSDGGFTLGGVRFLVIFSSENWSVSFSWLADARSITCFDFLPTTLSLAAGNSNSDDGTIKNLRRMETSRCLLDAGFLLKLRSFVFLWLFVLHVTVWLASLSDRIWHKNNL